MNGIHFTKVGSVKTAGFSTSPENYEFIHDSSFKGTNYYRLKMIDLDGGYEYSHIEEINFSSGVNPDHIDVFPNPTDAPISLALQNNRNYEIELFNIAGQRVAYFINTSILDLANFESGTYILQIKEEASGTQYRDRIVKVN